MFKGSFVALVTPFKRGKVDEEKLRELVQFHLKEGTDGIVPCGTTGESATLDFEEHKKVIQIVVEEVKGKIPVIAGTGSNSTREAEELTLFAKNVGTDGALVITPYYNKPTSRGMEAHYLKLAQIGIPIVIYNVPSRTGINIPASLVAKLSQNPNIVGIKEASGDMDQVSTIISSSPEGFCVLSGNDSHTLPILALGGVGVISVVANIVPRKMKDLVKYALEGKMEEAKKIHHQIFSLCKAMFIETNPIPVKTAMSMLGMIERELRLPLFPMGEENEKRLKAILLSSGLEVKE